MHRQVDVAMKNVITCPLFNSVKPLLIVLLQYFQDVNVILGYVCTPVFSVYDFR